ncbi:MAG: YggS family pyridoxal phosphate-dependent enzyme [Aestuariivirga sp.]
MTDSLTNWKNIKQQIAGRAQLVAVSKTLGADEIRPVLEAGQRLFGENRVQEAQGKWPELRRHYPDLELHLIGPLQSNKAADAVTLFDVIQTVDRPKIAQALAAEMKKQNKALPCFVQVNIGHEPQKVGIMPEALDDFLKLVQGEYGLDIVGLMCIPPADENPQPYFRELARMAKRHGLKQLSMGMSSDFELAIVEGATHVRVGSGIFGGRPQITK